MTENAYACDPRVARFKELDKQRKLEEKQARAAAARKRAEEELQVGLIDRIYFLIVLLLE